MSRIEEHLPFKPMTIAVLTISDTRTLANDKSGDTLVGLIEADGHTIGDRAVVRDTISAIQEQIKTWIENPGINVIITTGGTGLTGRDVTPEAVRPLLEKEIDGFSVLMHMLSYQSVGTSTIQSRALAGIAGGTYIFCCPGSPGACKDAWSLILRFQLDSRHIPCNMVEIMPRLREQQ